MKKTSTIICLAILTLFVSCKKSMNSEEINEKTSSGVVLIMNYCYYSVSIPGGEDIYFTGVDESGQLKGLTYDEAEAWNNCSGCTGTGFFISPDGQIMTNRHVVRPEVGEDIVKSFLRSYKKAMKGIYQEKMSQLETQYYSYADDAHTQQQIALRYKQYSELLQRIDDTDMSEAEFETHSKISIAYNGSHVAKAEDFKSCSIVAVSEEENLDLAIIQLDEGETPEGKYVFSLKDEDETLTLDQKLYMIGYNQGFTISKTAQGIQSQIYSGNVTQKSDGEKILYSIPSLPGSSGSPVVDEYGDLVAVNFAGFQGTQGFNYGIPSKRIRQFLKDN